MYNIKYIDRPDIITGPAVAGAMLAVPISLRLNKAFVYPEKVRIWIDSLGNITTDEEDVYQEKIIMQFRRGYDRVIKNKTVWIVEDIITTGNSVEKTIQAVKDCGGLVSGVSAIWNRGEYKSSKGLFIPLIDETIYSYLPIDCPECADSIPLTDPKE